VPKSKNLDRDETQSNRIAQEPIGIPDSPFLTVREAARFCRFDNCEHPEIAFRQWARRMAIPARRRGKQKLLFEGRVLEQFLRSA
jgi:hypothetical protein